MTTMGFIRKMIANVCGKISQSLPLHEYCSSLYKDRHFPVLGGTVINQGEEPVEVLTSDYHDSVWASFYVMPGEHSRDACFFDIDMLAFKNGATFWRFNQEAKRYVEEQRVKGRGLLKISDLCEVRVKNEKGHLNIYSDSVSCVFPAPIPLDTTAAHAFGVSETNILALKDHPQFL